jgi:SAM-dependent methyltransferase
VTSVFDAVADRYDRIRPGYPDALFDELLALARLPDRGRILEVGCGTGQATVSVARRGFPMTCLEPGAKMAALARRNLAAFPDVAIIEQTFEAFSALPEHAQSFDLVLSAQAFHWVARAVRFELAAYALRPAGAMALVANYPELVAPPLRAEFEAAYRQCAPSLKAGSDPLRYEVEEDFSASRRFRLLPVRVHRWSRVYSNHDYLSLLQTHSDHILLPAPEREALLDRLGAILAARGESIRIDYNTRLVVGHRLP